MVKYLRLKQSGSTISQAFKNHRDYTNPVFLEKMIGFFEIEQYGTCFDPAIFDPEALPREDYFDRYCLGCLLPCEGPGRSRAVWAEHTCPRRALRCSSE